MTSKGSAVLEQIFSRGYASVCLESAESALLGELFEKAAGFFSMSETEKLRYGVENRVTGYRPFSYANTGSADKPDLNDSFLYWKHRRASQPYQEEIAAFLDAAEAYRAVAADVVSGVIEELREHYAYKSELPFEQASVLQINSFVKTVDREFYQFAHEDADLLTVIWASHPGLEGVFEGGRVETYDFTTPGEVLIMPGSLLTAMTGDKIDPFFHRVRNYNTPDRKSIMYFVSPEATRPIEPFEKNCGHTAEDIQRMVIENPQMHFGLSGDFVSA